MTPAAPPISAAPPAPPTNIISAARRLSLWFKISMTVLLVGSLCDTNDAHHPGLLMVGDVAVEHPVAGMVGDEGEVGALAGRDELRVAPLSEWIQVAVPADHPKVVPV